jgi:hypothetical protein
VGQPQALNDKQSARLRPQWRGTNLAHLRPPIPTFNSYFTMTMATNCTSPSLGGVGVEPFPASTYPRSDCGMGGAATVSMPSRKLSA